MFFLIKYFNFIYLLCSNFFLIYTFRELIHFSMELSFQNSQKRSHV